MNPEHARLPTLPEWPGKTVGMLATGGADPHVIPVSAPVRAGAARILISLHRTRGSLARLRREPAVSILILAEGNIAFSAQGHARVIEEPMKVDERYVASEIAVDSIDDHQQDDFTVTGGIDQRMA